MIQRNPQTRISVEDRMEGPGYGADLIASLLISLNEGQESSPERREEGLLSLEEAEAATKYSVAELRELIRAGAIPAEGSGEDRAIHSWFLVRKPGIEILELQGIHSLSRTELAQDILGPVN